MIRRPEVAWSALASHWDTSGAAWNTPVAERLVTLARLRPHMSVLDAGCGTGAATFAAARAVAPAYVTGVDVAAAMVVRARERAREQGIRNVIFACEDAAKLPYPPLSFDAVISSLAVAYLTSPSRAVSRWAAILRPGGTLAFSWVKSDDDVFRAAYAAVDQFVAAEDRWDHARQRLDEQTADKLLSGLEDVHTDVEPVTTRYRSMEHWWESSWTQAPGIAWAHIPQGFREDARRAAFDVVKVIAGADGSLERTRIVGYTTARSRVP